MAVVGNDTTVSSGVAHALGMWSYRVDGDVTATNIIVAGNTGSAKEAYSAGLLHLDFGGSTTVTNVTVHGNELLYTETFHHGAFTCSNADLTAVNVTVSGNVVDGDLALSSSSSLVDAGDASISDADGTTSGMGA